MRRRDPRRRFGAVDCMAKPRGTSRLQHAVVLFFDLLSGDGTDVENKVPDRGFLACVVSLT